MKTPQGEKSSRARERLKKELGKAERQRRALQRKMPRGPATQLAAVWPLVIEDWMRGPPELAAELMKPCGGAIDIWEVGKDVGNVRNNKPGLLDRVALI